MNINTIEEKLNKRKAKIVAERKEMFRHLKENQIRFDDCINGYTYEVDARNFRFAIFYNGKFYGIRNKWHDEFIDAEIHWDEDKRFGTVRPHVEIGETPDKEMNALKIQIGELKTEDDLIYYAEFNRLKFYFDEMRKHAEYVK